MAFSYHWMHIDGKGSAKSASPAPHKPRIRPGKVEPSPAAAHCLAGKLPVSLLTGVESSMRKTIRLACCALAIGTLGLYAVPANAQTQSQEQCGPRDEVIKVLNAKYQESQRALGLINEKAMMELYISSRGTWTMVVTNEAGISCVLAAGEAWDEKPLKTLGQSS
jgi:hypothetical protein